MWATRLGLCQLLEIIIWCGFKGLRRILDGRGLDTDSEWAILEPVATPVMRGLVAHPKDWAWSSYRHWESGVGGAVAIESPWIFARRINMAQKLLVGGMFWKPTSQNRHMGHPTWRRKEVRCGPPAKKTRAPDHFAK